MRSKFSKATWIFYLATYWQSQSIVWSWIMLAMLVICQDNDISITEKQ